MRLGSNKKIKLSLKVFLLIFIQNTLFLKKFLAFNSYHLHLPSYHLVKKAKIVDTTFNSSSWQDLIFRFIKSQIEHKNISQNWNRSFNRCSLGFQELAEACSELDQTSKTELFSKIVNGSWLCLQKSPCWMFEWILSTLWLAPTTKKIRPQEYGWEKYLEMFNFLALFDRYTSLKIESHPRKNFKSSFTLNFFLYLTRNMVEPKHGRTWFKKRPLNILIVLNPIQNRPFCGSSRMWGPKRPSQPTPW